MFYVKYGFTFFVLIFVFFISPTAFSASAEVQPIKLMAEIFPPFQYKYKDEVIGVSSDIVNAIQEELEIVENNKNTALFSMLRTDERERKYKWVGPLATMKLVFFKKKGSKITLHNLDDAKN